MTRRIRSDSSDILEHISAEIGSHKVNPLASFMTCDDGRPRLVGMSRGNRWTLEREQRAFERANKAELRKLAQRKYRRKWAAAHADTVRALVRKWRAANVERTREQYRQYRAKTVTRRRQQDRGKYARQKADPVRYAAKRLRNARAYARRRRAQVTP